MKIREQKGKQVQMPVTNAPVRANQPEMCQQHEQASDMGIPISAARSFQEAFFMHEKLIISIYSYGYSDAIVR